MRPQRKATRAISPSYRVALKPIVAALTLASALAASDQATAQVYPTKPIRIICPCSAGSPPDVLGRMIGQGLAKRLGQAVTVDNRPGAAGAIGTRAAAAADPDGHTLLQVFSAFAYAPALNPKSGYDPVKGFSAVASLASWSFILVVPADLPVQTVQDLVAYAKANPGQVKIGHTLGSPPQIMAGIFKTATGAPLDTVPYRAVTQLTADLLAGRIQAFFGAGPRLISLVREGKLRALAYTGAARHPALPQVPTVIESGLPQLALKPGDWIGLVAPVGTPPEAIERLNAAVGTVLVSPDVRATFAKLGWDAVSTSPREFAMFLAAETRKWPALLKAAGLTSD